MNPFYITPETILNRLSRTHKGKDISMSDVIEWAAECTTEYIEDFDSFIRYDGVELLSDNNNRFYLPCLVYRILDVYIGNSRIKYKRKAGYIETDDKSYKKIFINYIGIPTTAEGDLLIDKNHAQAVEAFIVYKVYYEDFLNNKLHPNAWTDIKLTMENELIAARSSFRHWDQSRFDTMQAIRGNMIPELARTPLFNLYSIAK